MRPDQIKERIKLGTEVLKSHFIALIALVTATFSLVLRENSDRLGDTLIVVGFPAAVIVVALIVSLHRRIRALIKLL